MPGLGSFSLSTAAASAILLLWSPSVAVPHASSLAAAAAAAADSSTNTSQRRFPESPTTGKVAEEFRGDPPAFDGKVDIFLDLACPDSAAAWTTIRRIVWEYAARTELVFHVLPMPLNQMAFDAAKAVQAVQLFSADDGEEVFLFLDAMFDYHPLILDGAGDSVARLGFRGILTKWALAAGSITEDQFESAMETSEIDHLVRYETGDAATFGVYTTPTALINGNFMAKLVGAKQLNDFRLLFAAGMESLSLYGSDGASISEPIEGRWILDGEDDTLSLKYYGIDDSSHPRAASE